MGLINDSLKGTLSRATKVPTAFGPDFAAFLITEYINGREAETIKFVGNFMPLVPFKFGGKQEIKKEFYPGNSEPTVQILGPRENSVTVNGRFKLKRVGYPSNPDESLRETAVAYQQQIDAMRIRGNLVKVKLGEWYRYGFIEECEFELTRLTDIGYSITFNIIGFNPPKNSMFLGQSDENPVVPNKTLITQALSAMESSRQFPASMPTTLAETLDGFISNIAEAINLVTGFVDGILDDAEKLQQSANRALGLIKNARSTISTTSRRIGQISQTSTSMGSKFNNEYQKTAAMISNVNHLHKIQSNNMTMVALLNELQARFKAMAATIPMGRHLIRTGDTLQKISILFYNTADNWEAVYRFNKLQSTTLTVGKVLEIPRL